MLSILFKKQKNNYYKIYFLLFKVKRKVYYE